MSISSNYPYGMCPHCSGHLVAGHTCAGSIMNKQNAAPAQSSTASRNATPSQEGVGQGEVAAAAPLGCTKLYRGQWLRVEVIHRGDVEKLRIECFYGYGPQWQAL